MILHYKNVNLPHIFRGTDHVPGHRGQAGTGEAKECGISRTPLLPPCLPAPDAPERGRFPEKYVADLRFYNAKSYFTKYFW